MDVAANILGRLCENLNIESINCVSKCCNGSRSSSSDPGESVSDPKEPGESGGSGQVMEGSQEKDSKPDKKTSTGVPPETVLIHPTQTFSKKVQKKKSRSSKH